MQTPPALRNSHADTRTSRQERETAKFLDVRLGPRQQEFSPAQAGWTMKGRDSTTLPGTQSPGGCAHSWGWETKRPSRLAASACHRAGCFPLAQHVWLKVTCSPEPTRHQGGT